MGDNPANSKSTQKLPRHHSYASSTEDSHSGKSSKTYNSGAKAGGGGAKRDPDGPSPFAGPKSYTKNT